MKPFNHSKAVKNILKVYSRATDADMAVGLAWYYTAHNMALSFGLGPDRGAGVIAAFSPMVSWKRNLELAAAAARDEWLPGMKNPQSKARAILAGALPSNVLKGPKVRAFYRSIQMAGNTDDVVIDRHALSVALGRNATEKERSALDGKVYEQYSRAYRSAALKTGIRVSDLQAITWIVWRREKGIVD